MFMNSPALNESQISFGGQVLDVQNPAVTFPAVSNLLFAPLNIFWSVQQAVDSQFDGDHEGFKNALLQLVSAITSLIHAIPYTFALVNDYVHTFMAATSFATALPIVGYVLCGIGFIQESIELIKQAIFNSKLFGSYQSPKLKAETEPQLREFIRQAKRFTERMDQPFFHESKEQLMRSILTLESHLDAPNYEEAHQVEKKLKAALNLYNIQVIRKDYFSLSSSDIQQLESLNQMEMQGVISIRKRSLTMIKHEKICQNKAKSFARRVQPWLFKEYTQNAARLENSLKQMISTGAIDEASLTEATTLINKINNQSRKAMIIHVIALSALALSIAALAVTTVTVPFVPAGFAIAAGIFALVAWGIKSGMMPTEGFRFEAKYLLPFCIREKLGLK